MDIDGGVSHFYVFKNQVWGKLNLRDGDLQLDEDDVVVVTVNDQDIT